MESSASEPGLNWSGFIGVNKSDLFPILSKLFKNSCYKTKIAQIDEFSYGDCSGNLLTSPFLFQKMSLSNPHFVAEGCRMLIQQDEVNCYLFFPTS